MTRGTGVGDRGFIFSFTVNRFCFLKKQKVYRIFFYGTPVDYETPVVFEEVP